MLTDTLPVQDAIESFHSTARHVWENAVNDILYWTQLAVDSPKLREPAWRNAMNDVTEAIAGIRTLGLLAPVMLRESGEGWKVQTELLELSSTMHRLMILDLLRNVHFDDNLPRAA